MNTLSLSVSNPSSGKGSSLRISPSTSVSSRCSRTSNGAHSVQPVAMSVSTKVWTWRRVRLRLLHARPLPHRPAPERNRLGRHYSRFPPFLLTPALAGQLLALRKLCDAGSNRRSQVSCHCDERSDETISVQLPTLQSNGDDRMTLPPGRF